MTPSALPHGPADVATLKVAIVEDQTTIREGLARLIDAAARCRCVGAFASMEAALDGIERELPDVVLTDLGLPGLSGIEGIRRVNRRHPRLPVLVLTVHADDERIFEAICAGACGYLLKTTPPARLLEGLHEAVEGGAPTSPEVARRILEVFRGASAPADLDLDDLDRRLLELIADGHTYRTAARELGPRVDPRDAAVRMKQVYEKLQARRAS